MRDLLSQNGGPATSSMPRIKVPHLPMPMVVHYLDHSAAKESGIPRQGGAATSWLLHIASIMIASYGLLWPMRDPICKIGIREKRIRVASHPCRCHGWIGRDGSLPADDLCLPERMTGDGQWRDVGKPRQSQAGGVGVWFSFARSRAGLPDHVGVRTGG